MHERFKKKLNEGNNIVLFINRVIALESWTDELRDAIDLYIRDSTPENRDDLEEVLEMIDKIIDNNFLWQFKGENCRHLLNDTKEE